MVWIFLCEDFFASFDESINQASFKLLSLPRQHDKRQMQPCAPLQTRSRPGSRAKSFWLIRSQRCVSTCPNWHHKIFIYLYVKLWAVWLCIIDLRAAVGQSSERKGSVVWGNFLAHRHWEDAWKATPVFSLWVSSYNSYQIKLYISN